MVRVGDAREKLHSTCCGALHFPGPCVKENTRY